MIFIFELNMWVLVPFTCGNLHWGGFENWQEEDKRVFLVLFFNFFVCADCHHCC